MHAHSCVYPSKVCGTSAKIIPLNEWGCSYRDCVYHAKNRGNKEIPLAILSRILAQSCITPPYIIQAKVLRVIVLVSLIVLLRVYISLFSQYFAWCIPSLHPPHSFNGMIFALVMKRNCGVCFPHNSYCSLPTTSLPIANTVVQTCIAFLGGLRGHFTPPPRALANFTF